MIPQLVLKIGDNNIFDTILASHDDLLLNPPIVEPRLSILMSPTLEVKVGVLTKVKSNFWEPLRFHVVKLLLIHQISKHSCTFNGRQTNFDQDDRIVSISLDLEVVGYEYNR